MMNDDLKGDLSDEEIYSRLRKLVMRKNRLTRLFNEGKIEREKYISNIKKINSLIETLQNIKIDKLKKEYREYDIMLGSLETKFKKGEISEAEYERRSRELKDKIMKINQDIVHLECIKSDLEFLDFMKFARREKERYFIFPMTLWILIIILALFDILGLLYVILNPNAFVNALPEEHRTSPYIAAISILLGFIMMIYIYTIALLGISTLVGIEKMTLKKAFRCVSAQLITALGVFILAVLFVAVRLENVNITYDLLVSVLSRREKSFIVGATFLLHWWILKTGLRTTWSRAFITLLITSFFDVVIFYLLFHGLFKIF